MLEQRLGRFGYHLGTLLALLVVAVVLLTVVSMAGGIFIGMTLVFDLSAPKAAGDIGFAVGLAVLAGVGTYYGTDLVQMRKRRRLNEKAKEIEEHMDFHATHGDHMIVTVSSEDAQKQWPEIERRLNAWEREQDAEH